MCTKNELNTILSRMSEAYRTIYGDEIKKILLYGSYARGDNEKYSDIDIVAIVDGERSDLQSKLTDLWDVSSDLELEYATIVSPTVIPYDEFNKYKDVLPYYKNIENEGIEIHD